MKKNNVLLYLCIALFGIVGIYLTFIAGNTDKYDSKTKAYQIYPNESYDSDSGTTYQPIYYFRVKGEDYECLAKTRSSSYPDEDKNTVYYDSNDPTKCKTEYDKSTSKVAGIICLVVTAIMVFFFIIKKPSDNETNINQEIGMENQNQIDPEKAEKIIKTVEKVSLIYKRVIIGIIIAILLFFILIETVIVKQTYISRNYIETAASFVERTPDGESSAFDDCIYAFTDKDGVEQKIVLSIPKDDEPKYEIKLKYNESNPQEFYEEGAYMDKSSIIWYIVKIVALILLIFLFSNKKLLSKISISN
jgi:hypothetical protein